VSGRVPWARYEGDDVEAVIAIMLLRQHRHGWRVRPSQGDGGLDVVIRLGPRDWEIYQVKRFTTKLNSSHKTQIEKSWKRMLEYTREKQVRVTAWHVVRPLDASREDHEWLENLTNDSGIPSDWKGLADVDGWAARFPDVIDYYFEGGSQRVLDTAREFVRAAGLERAAEAGQIGTPDTALDGLVAVSKSLNAIDPHYRYRLAAEEAPPDGQFQMAPTDVEGLVYSRAVMRDGVLAQIDVYTRYDEALLDRPMPVEASLTLQPASEAEYEAVGQFLAYGVPLHQMPAQILSTESPHGFGLADMTEGAISLLPARGSKAQPFDLVVTNAQGQEAGRALLVMQPPTTGVDGRGRQAWFGTDPSSVLSLKVFLNFDEGRAGLALSVGDISGADPYQALEVLTVLAAMEAGTRVALHVRGGPEVLPLGPLPQRPFAEDDDVLHTRIAVCGALATLQTRISVPLRVPDMATIEVDDVREWLEAATLLRGGEIRKAWSALMITLSGADTDLRLPRVIRVTRALTVCLAGQSWTVGYVDQLAQAASWTPATDDQRRGALAPGVDDTVRVMLTHDADAPARAASGQIQMADPGQRQRDTR
jgi:hypothetical protein